MARRCVDVSAWVRWSHLVRDAVQCGGDVVRMTRMMEMYRSRSLSLTGESDSSTAYERADRGGQR